VSQYQTLEEDMFLMKEISDITFSVLILAEQGHKYL